MTVLGIEFGSQALRAVTITGANGDTPVENTIIIDYALPQYSEETEELDISSQRIEALSRLSQKLKGRFDAICLAIDGSLARLSNVALPFNDPRMLSTILPQNLPEELGADDFLCHQVGRETADDEGNLSYDIQTLIYPKSTLRSILTELREVGLDPHVVKLSSQISGYGLHAITNPSLADATTFGIVNLDLQQTNVTIFTNVVNELNGQIERQAVQTRTLRLEMHTLVQYLMQTLEMHEMSAQTAVKNYAFMLSAENRDEAILQINDTFGLLDENQLAHQLTIWEACQDDLENWITALLQIKQALTYRNDLELNTIYITGELSKIFGIDRYLSEELGINVEILNFIDRDENNVTWLANCAAKCALTHLKTPVELNLRYGEFGYQGSLEFIKEKRWLWVALIALLLIAIAFMFIAQNHYITAKQKTLALTLETSSEQLFGEKMHSLSEVQKALTDAEGYDFIPKRTAFTTFEWMSNTFHANLADVSFDISTLDIDAQRKIVSINGEVNGDDGLPRIMEVLESYECFPDSIAEPQTRKVKDKVTFRLRIESNHCGSNQNKEEQ